MQRIKLPQMNCITVGREIGNFVIESVLENNATGCVIGLSGGVDSSTSAALIKTAFNRYGKTHKAHLSLVGYILPSNMNNEKDIVDAQFVADYLDIPYEVLNIEKLVRAFKLTNPEAFENSYDQGNLTSRIRANVLSTKAATEKKILAGTGNKDEDFGIGYYTLFGDGAVHISPIAGLSKRLVREMALFSGLPGHIARRTPTAGLEPGQSDYKDLGYEYDIVELITEGLKQGLTADQLAVHDQVVEPVKRQIAEYQESFGVKKFETVTEVVEDILHRHMTAGSKMKIIHPPAPVITLFYD
ncbi:MAG: NAD(+) synthase [Desulfobacteraceae bacterium 4572_123]|nr:MAG: NAD(+) synthase [Desulfobacteraceae bacterium 4572_123]